MSEMMHLTRWTEFSGFSVAAERHRAVDPLNPPVPFGNTNILDRVLVDLTSAKYFSRWRILDHSGGPKWNAEPGDREVLENKYWDTLEDAAVLALAEVRTINDALKYQAKPGAQTVLNAAHIRLLEIENSYVENLKKLRDYAETEQDAIRANVNKMEYDGDPYIHINAG